MKILVVHNRYKTKAPSGENIYVEKEVLALENLGYEVRTCYIENNDLRHGILSYFVVFFELFLPIRSFIMILRIERKFKPDIIHFHNTFPRIGWMSLRYFAKKAVLTAHNYRLFCANGVALRADNVCTLCSDPAKFWNTTKHKCYRGSYFSTLAVKIYIYLLRKYGKLSDLQSIFCFSDYQRELVLNFYPDLMRVIKIKNNVHDLGRISSLKCVKSKPIALFIGRFTVEKGIPDLVKCISKYPDMFEEIHFVGGTISDLATLGCEGVETLQNIRVHGKVNRSVVEKFLKFCDLLLVPSNCLEGQPTVIFEALEHGCLPIVSKVPTLVDLSKKLGLKCVIDFTDHENFHRNYVRMIEAHNKDIENITRDFLNARQLFTLRSDFYENVMRL